MDCVAVPNRRPPRDLLRHRIVVQTGITNDCQHPALRCQPTLQGDLADCRGNLPVLQSRRIVEIPVRFLSDRDGGLGALSGAHTADGRDFSAAIRVACAAHQEAAMAIGSGTVPARHQPVLHHRVVVHPIGGSHGGQLSCASIGDRIVGAAAQGASDPRSMDRGDLRLYRRADHRPPRR
ncbi:hypothetical protein D3C81_1417800 [compost metagenome]